MAGRLLYLHQEICIMNVVKKENKLKEILIGKARNLSDRNIYHKISLVALFAWVGLGSDGLSSSCYGPEEAFLALGKYTSLSILVALACVITIAVICTSYAQIIEKFPGGGGGYLVASKLLSPAAGVVSGSALLLDYVLTIALSAASGADALFSLIPAEFIYLKLPAACAGIIFLTVLNMRGVRESVLLWAPVFFIFLITHAIAIFFAIGSHAGDAVQVAAETSGNFKSAVNDLGWLGIAFLVLKAYSMGAGTYTGIEAVSNGLPVLREPKVKTGKTTMLYMGLSLGITVCGLFIAYLLYKVEPQSGKTLNAVLFGAITANWPSWLAGTFVSVAMLSAAILLFIAAQTGFLDGPRVLANMAVDRWAPMRFATLSDRLVTQNGIILMGGMGLLIVILGNGSVSQLIVLYSINVFITFSISQLGMSLHWWRERFRENKWKTKFFINALGFTITFFILISLCAIKFTEGGWLTLLFTGFIIGCAFLCRRHYNHTSRQLSRLNELVKVVENETAKMKNGNAVFTHEKKQRTAVFLVNGFNGLGLHTLLNMRKMFPDTFDNFIFVQVGIVDAGNFKGESEIAHLRKHIFSEASRYADYMRKQGFSAEVLTDAGADFLNTATALINSIKEKHNNAVFFGGQLVFSKDTVFNRFLHNYTAFALQRELFRNGIPFVILPIHVYNE